SGSLFTGFLLAALSVLGTQKATTAVAIVVPILGFGFPVVDTAMTMARRLVSRKPVFQGDNEHIHHMLLARGWSQRRVALVLYGVCAAFGLLALIFPASGSKLTGFMMFVISVAVIIAVGHMLDFGEFTFANAQVGQAGRAEINERVFEASLYRHPKQELEFRNGRV